MDLAERHPERAARLRGALDRFAACARASSELRELTLAEREELSRLGYFDGSDVAPVGAVVHRH